MVRFSMKRPTSLSNILYMIGLLYYRTWAYVMCKLAQILMC